MKKNQTLEQRKKAIEEELAAIRVEEEKEIQAQLKADNYKKFKERAQDWIIGKAHAQFDLRDNGWHHPKGERLDCAVLPTSVSINGNCGHTYIATAEVTSATNTYFHNVIPGNYQRWFTKKMIDITKELMDMVQ